MLSFYFFIGCLSLVAFTEELWESITPKKKQKTEKANFKRHTTWDNIENITAGYETPFFYPVPEGGFLDSIRVSLKRKKMAYGGNSIR